MKNRVMQKAKQRTHLETAPSNQLDASRPEDGHGHVAASIRSAQGITDRSVNHARSTAAAILEAWWSCFAPDLPIAPRPDGLPVGVGNKAEDISKKLAVGLLDFAEQDACRTIAEIYTGLLPPEEKSANGIFYTRPALVERLLDIAEASGHDWKVGRVIDPSGGCGAFITQAAVRMKTRLSDLKPDAVLKSIESRLTAWDIDPFATWMGQVAVEAVLIDLVRATGRRLATIVENRDALLDFECHKGRYSLVLGNPPFGRIKDNPAIRSTFARSLHGHPNLYGLFMDLAIHLASGNGTIAYVTPTSWLSGSYFSNLRHLIQTSAPPSVLEIVESRKAAFEDVLQEIALVVLQKGKESRSLTVSTVRMEEKHLSSQHTCNVTLPDDSKAPWIVPRQADDEKLVRALARTPRRLKDWGYRVSTGPLVWNRQKHALHGEPSSNCVKVIWAEAVTRPDEIDALPQKAAHRRHAFYSPSPRAGSKDPLSDPAVVRGPCVLVQRTTSKEQDRRVIAAELPAHVGLVAIENHLNMLVPTRRDPQLTTTELAKFLSTAFADRIVRCISGSVALSASELASVPVIEARAIRKALSSRDPEEALARAYGVEP